MSFLKTLMKSRRFWVIMFFLNLLLMCVASDAYLLLLNASGAVCCVFNYRRAESK